MIVEKPPDSVIQELIRSHGNFPEFELEDPMGPMLDREYHPDGSIIGEVVVVVEWNRTGIVLVIHHLTSNDWILPMGRIISGETVKMAAMREAREETGLDVEITDVLGVYKITFAFKNCKLVRWHFLVSAKCVGGNLVPQDHSEIKDVKVVSLHRLYLETHSRWSKFWHHSLLSIYQSRIEDTLSFLAEEGVLIQHEISLDDFIHYFSDDAPSGDVTTIHDVFRNPWLLCHEIVEMNLLKAQGFEISAQLLHSDPESVLEAHVTASEVELMLARRFGDENWISERLEDVQNWLEDSELADELRVRLERLKDMLLEDQ